MRMPTKRATSVDPFLVAVVNPFADEASGARLPDADSYPSLPGNYSARNTYTVNANGSLAFRVTPTPQSVFTAVASASVDATGLVSTWTTGAVKNTITNYTSFVNAFTMFRHVAWGVRIAATSALTNTSGALYVGYYPNNYDGATTDLQQPPSTPDQILSLPWSFTVPLVELNEQPIIMTGKRLDPTSQQYTPINYPTASIAGINTGDGWGSWFFILTGGGNATTTLSVEFISRNELIPRGNSVMYGTGMPAPCDSRLFDTSINIQQVAPDYYIDSQDSESVYDRVIRLIKLADARLDFKGMAIGLARSYFTGGTRPGSYLRARRLLN